MGSILSRNEPSDEPGTIQQQLRQDQRSLSSDMMSGQRRMRFRDTVVPLLASPVGAIVVFYTIHYMNDSRSLLAPSGVIVVYAYGLMFALIFVMPLLLVVRRLRLLSWWATIIWGALVGLAVAALIRRPFGWDVFSFNNASLLVSCGAAAAFVYWLIAQHSYRRRQPRNATDVSS